MKIKIIFVLLVLANGLFAQTGDRKEVPGTKCSLVPPPGFVAASKFCGFQHNASKSTIIVFQLPAPAKEMIEAMNPDSLEEGGMTLIDSQLTGFNKSKAALFFGKKILNGTMYIKQLLVFGDEKNTVIIYGFSPQANKDMAYAILRSLRTAIYNESQDDHLAETIKFTLDVSGTEFRVTKYLFSCVVYTIDDKIPTHKPSLVASSCIEGGPIHNQKKFCIALIKRPPLGESIKIKENNRTIIDDLKGYEIVAHGKDKDGKATLIYQVILFTEYGYYYIIYGQASEEQEKYVENFKKISRTFKVK